MTTSEKTAPRKASTKRTPPRKAVGAGAGTRKSAAKKVVSRGTGALKQPAAEAVPTSVVAKPKHKLIRDSFTIPKSEYAVLDALKLRAANLKRPTKKSELLRAGIAALNGMHDKAFLTALGAVPSLKTGRPKSPAPKAAK